MKKILGVFFIVFLILGMFCPFVFGDAETTDAVLAGGGAGLTAGSILESHLNATAGPTDNFILSFDQASGGFTWVAAGAGDVTGLTGGDGIRIDNGTTATPDVFIDYDENTTDLEGTAIAAADVLLYMDSDNTDDMARGLVSDLPFETTVSEGSLANSVIITDDVKDGTLKAEDFDFTNLSLVDFTGEANWKVWYSDGSGDIKELALGADGTFFQSGGAAALPEFTALLAGDIPDLSGTYATVTSINTLDKLETVSNGGAYMSNMLAATSEANFKNIMNLESGTDYDVSIGATIIVAASGGDYTDLSTAVGAASANDTILVYPGTYADTLTVAVDNLSIIAMGSPFNTTLTQVDANLIDFGATTGGRIVNFSLLLSAPTTAIAAVQGSTGNFQVRMCKSTLTCTQALSQADQPMIGQITGTGTLQFNLGQVSYTHSGATTTGIKAPFKSASSGIIKLYSLKTVDVNGSGSSGTTTLGITLGTSYLIVEGCNIDVDDDTSTTTAGLGYIASATSVSTEFMNNNIHVHGAANNAYGAFALLGSFRSALNHIHVECSGGGNAYSFVESGSGEIDSHMDDIIATGGYTGNVHMVSSTADGVLTVSGTGTFATIAATDYGLIAGDIPDISATYLILAGDGGSLTNLDGENLQVDSVDNDSIDWGDMTDLGTDGVVTWGNIAEGELANSTVVTADIKDGEVTEADLNATNAPGAGEDNYVLTYNHASTNFTWAADATGGAPATADISDVSVTQTELAELEAIGETVIEAADWTAVAAMSGVNSGDNTDAETGDSATDFFDAGEIVDARVSDTLTATTIVVADNENTNETNAIIFSSGGDIDGGSYQLESDGDFTYDPDTGTMTATTIAATDYGLIAGDIPDISATYLILAGAGSSLTAVDAITGDSATSFFDAGAVETNFGGTGTDLSGTSGLMGMNAGTYVDIDTADELETYAVLGAYASNLLNTTSEANFKETVNAEAGVDFQAYDADLATLAAPTTWRMFYSNATSVMSEVALGANNTFLEFNGVDQIPAARVIQMEDLNDLTLDGTPANEAGYLLQVDGDGTFSPTNSLSNITLTIGGDQDFADFDLTSIDKLEGIDALVYIDMGADGKVIIAADGTVEILVADEDLTIADGGANIVTVASNTGVTDIGFSAINLSTTGTLNGRIPVGDDAVNNTITKAEMNSIIYANDDDTWVLGDIDAADGLGWSVCIYQSTAAITTVDPDAEDMIRDTFDDGGLETAGELIASTAVAGSMICLVVTDFTGDVAHWSVMSENGAWTPAN